MTAERRTSQLTLQEEEPDTIQLNQLKRAIERLELARSNVSGRHDWLEEMINQIPDYIYAKDLEGRFLFANKAVVVDNGLESLDDLIGKSDFDLHPFEAATAIDTVEKKVMETGKPDLGIEEISLSRNGGRWLMMSRLPLRDRHGKTIGVLGMSRDISARKEAEQLLQAQARLLELVARGMPLDDFLTELVRMIEAQVTGLEGSVMLMTEDGRHLAFAAGPSLPAEYPELFSLVEIGPNVGSCGTAAWRDRSVIVTDIQSDPLWQDYRAIIKPFGYRSCWSTPIHSSQGDVLGTFALYSKQPLAPDARHDELVTVAAHLAGIAIERRRTEDRINFLARHDALTGLPNRLLMDSELKAALASAAGAGSGVALAFLDLDNFKLVNDSLGHAAGDDLLKIVAARIRETTGKDGIVGRVGGDEFIIILRIPRDDRATIARRFEAIRQIVAQPIWLEGMELQVTCSMGIACYPEHGATPSDLQANADAAMYRAKENGRDNLQLFSVEMVEKVRQKLALTEEMRRAIREDEFVLHFQPQLNQNSGTVFGVEALVRWQHPVNGLVPPSDFIPLAEENGLIVPLGAWVLREACRQCKAWQDQGLAPVVVSVNVSARQFRENGLIAEVAAALENARLEPRFLELELTESLIMQDLPRAVARMRELSALGLKLSIDDFGTGYSSLSTLKSFPVSRLKIDKSFLTDIPQDSGNMALTSAIVSLAQKLGLDVIAEGVETEAQAAFLRECGCEDIQGYFVSRPVPAEKLIDFMRRPD